MGVLGLYQWVIRSSPKAVEYGIFSCHNLYLDLNGLVHPCCHDTSPDPEPRTEEEMFLRIFDTIDEVVSVAQPSQCLYLAVDGVAPRAKINQQRARRFAAAAERTEMHEHAMELVEDMTTKHDLPRPKLEKRWDHNVITPGTEFMRRLGEALRYFIQFKLNTDPAWKKLCVILSDASVPGEGEHKIMQFVRDLRKGKEYNEETVHCAFGMDADFISLGLATHEKHFNILRNQLDRAKKPIPHTYCVLSLSKFRKCLQDTYFSRLINEGVADAFRLIDDFIFLCFLVGNDFLPHVPLINVKSNSIDFMMKEYASHIVATSPGYLTENGVIHYSSLSRYLERLSHPAAIRALVASKAQFEESSRSGGKRVRAKKAEDLDDEIFEVLEHGDRNADERCHGIKRIVTSHCQLVGGAARELGNAQQKLDGKELLELMMNHFETLNGAIENAQKALRNLPEFEDGQMKKSTLLLKLLVRKEMLEKEFVVGKVKLAFEYGEGNWRPSYYKRMFNIGPIPQKTETSLPAEVQVQTARIAHDYLRGLQWELTYYMQGCPSWTWFYPYHFAPLLCELSAASKKMETEHDFELSAPLHPIVQLLAVLPRESADALPRELQAAVADENSCLAENYPEKIELDYAECVYRYEGIVKLPWVNCDDLEKKCKTLLKNDTWTELAKVGDVLAFVHCDSLQEREDAVDLGRLTCPVAGLIHAKRLMLRPIIQTDMNPRRERRGSQKEPVRNMPKMRGAYDNDISENRVRAFSLRSGLFDAATLFCASSQKRPRDLEDENCFVYDSGRLHRVPARYVYDKPSHCQELCRCFGDGGTCERRNFCNFVHADLSEAEEVAPHMNFAYDSLDKVSYQRLEPGNLISVCTESEAEEVRSELLLVTKCLLRIGTENLQYCVEFGGRNRKCLRGKYCNFVHKVYIKEGDYCGALAPQTQFRGTESPF